jgi:hypothetical protein
MRFDHWAAIWVLRWRFSSEGLPWRGGGDKAHERALTEAARAGWLVRRRASRKTIGVLLTPAGMSEGWRLVGIPGDAAARALQDVNRLGRGHQWVPEISFTRGNRGWGDAHGAELRALAIRFSPGLTLGWIESNCDTAGRVGYRVSDIGKTILAKGHAPANGKATRKPPPDPAALRCYERSYLESISWLNAQTRKSVGRPGEIGPCPLNTEVWAGWDCVSKRSKQAPSGHGRVGQRGR